MCGIVGYVGPQDAQDVVLEGLRRLEYRGYDSAGIALVAGGELASVKKAGKLANLEKELADRPLPAATVGIGHTRWATHGGPTDRNAHPHLSADGTVAVIHNGIIENFAVLRAECERAGVEFRSETDTEVAAHLLAAAYADLPESPGRLAEAMRVVSRRLEGAFTLVATAVTEPDTLVASRRSSPLVVGVGDGEYFLGSDVAAFIGYTRNALELGQDQVVEIDRNRGVTVTDFAGDAVEPKSYTVDWDAAAAEKGGYPWFMLKEIAEQPQAIADTLLGRLGPHGELVLDEVRLSDQELRDIDKIFVIACGTAFHAGMIAKYAIEHWTRIPVEVELASEFRYRDPVLDRSTLVIVISQSGETMDTLMALRHAKEQRARVLAICNANGSTIPRESDAVLYTHAGPEVAVASTKGFLTQIVACYLVGLFLAQVRGIKYEDEVSAIVADLRRLPDAVAEVLAGMEPVRELARSLAGANTILFLGRHVGFPVALEGALKLKELAYIHAEGFAAGELKHGSIALIDEGTPVVVIVPSPRSRGSVHGKVVSNIQEVRARGARTIVIAEEGDED
ncbi:MAG: glmS, partial [Blastococcus sp.]|nr:glmS [Blastococcus sp.]